jgi:hypothetical protein
VKVQVLTTASGIPVEFCFVPGSESDVQALKKLPMTVADMIELMIQRKSNSKRPDETVDTFFEITNAKRD